MPRRKSSRRRSSRRRSSSRRRRGSARTSARRLQRLRKTNPRTVRNLRRSLKRKPVYWTKSGKRPSFRKRRSFVGDLARKSRKSKRTTRGRNKGKYRIDHGLDLYEVPWSGSRGSKIQKRGYGWL